MNSDPSRCLVFLRVVLSPDRWTASQSNLESSWQKAGHYVNFSVRVCGQTFRALQRRRVICELEALWIWNGSGIKKRLLCEFGSSFLGQQQLSLRLRMYLRGMRCEGELNDLSWKLNFSVQFLETSRLRGERPPQCWVVVFFSYIIEHMDAVGLKKNSFLMWTIFKVFIEFVTLLLHFIFWFLSREACGILASRLGIEPAPPALKGRVWTTGLSQGSPSPFFMWNIFHLWIFQNSTLSWNLTGCEPNLKVCLPIW